MPLIDLYNFAKFLGTLTNINLFNVAADALVKPFEWLSMLLLTTGTLITGLAGFILNYVVWFTVVDMSNKIDQIGTIDLAWKTIRDIGNMGFIFVLLYAAIKTILGIGSDTKKLIVNVIVVAILINFSLFFTKVVIDASNVLAITLYDAIAPGALDMTFTKGLATTLMQPLKIQGFFNMNVAGIEGKRLIIIGVMGTIFALIAAFVFFAIAILLIIRFVVLIFIIILSPLAFLGYILPTLGDMKKKWLDALLGQAFFAPIYFLLTLIVIAVSRGLVTGAGGLMEGGNMASGLAGTVGASGTITSPPVSAIAIVVNFIIVIVLLIASIIISKQWADKAGHGVPGLTKWALGAAGGATLGMAGRLGRGTIGRVGQSMADDDQLKARAAKGGVGGMAARLALATGRKTGGASFDIRGSKLGGPLDAGKAQKGGFAEFRKTQSEEAEKRAIALGPSAVILDQAEQEVKKYREGTPARVSAQARLDQLKGIDDTRAKEILKVSGFSDKVINSEKGKEIIAGIKKAVPGEGSKRKESYAKVIEKSYWTKLQGYNSAAAAQIRKGKSKEKRLAEAYKEIAKDEEPATSETETPRVAPPSSPASPAPPTSTI